MNCGKLVMHVGKVDIVKLLSQLLEEFYPSFADKNLTYELSSNVPAKVITADGNLLARVFDNLINNAIKYGSDGKRVLVGIHATDTVVTVSVTNYGYVIPAAELPLIFDKFYRVEQSRSTNTGGTGLGLAISDRLVRMMGGHIALESEENKGSDFSFTLLQTVGRRPAEEDDKLTDGALAGLEGARILLVEDNELNLEIARTILEMQKCQVETALNGQEGVDRFCESSEGYYDLILMDIRMPVMDGLEAAKLIRASGRTDARTVPIVAMSANAFEEDVKKSLESGMNAHLAKPFQMEDLIRTMRRIIGRENRVGKNGPGETETE